MIHWSASLSVRFALTIACVITAVSTIRADESAPVLKPGDRVAILGGMFVERMQAGGQLEVELQQRRPEWRLSVRNLGWSGDDVRGIARKRFDGPRDGYARLLRDVETADPTVVLVVYGFSEAADGEATTAAFAAGLSQLTEDLASRDIRVALVTPFALPGVKVDGYQQRIDRCRASVTTVAADKQAAVLAIDWSPSDTELTEDRLSPNATGYEAVARQLADQLVGGRPAGPASKSLLVSVAAKNELFFHHYRPQNETYLFLFRKHEQGNNAVEIEQFRPLIDAADKAIWAAAK